MKSDVRRKKPVPKDPKSKELTEYFKKGGREGAMKDFFNLVKKASQKLKS